MEHSLVGLNSDERVQQSGMRYNEGIQEGYRRAEPRPFALHKALFCRESFSSARGIYQGKQCKDQQSFTDSLDTGQQQTPLGLASHANVSATGLPNDPAGLRSLVKHKCIQYNSMLMN